MRKKLGFALIAATNVMMFTQAIDSFFTLNEMLCKIILGICFITMVITEVWLLVLFIKRKFFFITEK